MTIDQLSYTFFGFMLGVWATLEAARSFYHRKVRPIITEQNELIDRQNGMLRTLLEERS